MTYPSGKVITYNYTNDRAISVLNGASNLAYNITYKPFGGMAGLTYGNAIAGTTGYDSQYRITGITAGAVMNLSYPTYDSNGNIQAINDGFDATKNKSFTYDALDRLSTATSSGIWGSLGWTYDGVGNRQTENSNSYVYYPNTNKLNTANGKSFGYDNNGNTTTEASRQYIYNQNQRLIQVNDGATTAYYTYNGNGQRAKKVVNGTSTIFHYSTTGQIIAESNSAGNVTAEYVYLSGQPLAKIEGVNTYYYHNDHLGTPQKMTDSSGVVRWSADYKPFGEAKIDQAVTTITNNLRFPGQYYDQETGLHHNYYRDYNPALGRYPQADPIGIEKGRNHLYAYVDDNPITNKDPLGLNPLIGSCHSMFVSHYYFGGGTTIDLSSWGLLGAFQNASSVRDAVNSFTAKAQLAAAQNAGTLCQGCNNGTKSGNFPLNDSVSTNVTLEPCLFSVGKSQFFRSANCAVSANCNSKTFSFNCSTSFRIRDWFRDPLDIGIEVGGTPYRINADWSGNISGSGRF